MANCATCQGLLVPDDDELKCSSCGRRAPAPAKVAGVSNGAGGLVIPLEIRPTSLEELWSALGMAEGKTGVQLLVDQGLTKGKARLMAKGETVYPGVFARLLKEHGITAKDAVALMGEPEAPRARRARQNKDGG